MKILVPIKRVPDYEMKVKLLPSGEGIQTDGIKWILNPFDEIAVEEALRIKEARGDVDVVVATVGAGSCSEQIRTALALGADRGILVQSDTAVDSDVAQQVLAALVRRDGYDLVILGKQAIDSDAGQTGQLLAANLDWPQATFASKIVFDEGLQTAKVTREVDGGLETIQVTMPAVITTDLRLNTPRYTTLPNIVKAKKKPLEEVPIASLGVAAEAKVKVQRMSMPQVRTGGTKVQSVAELVEKIASVAKAI